MKPHLSIVLATYNEEKNIADCLASVKDIADEIVLVDGSSTDKTREIARDFSARVIKTVNPPIFHINKQKALEKARGEWILQLDADERVTPELAQEIKNLIGMKDSEVEKYQKGLVNKKLFARHQKLIEERDGRVGTSGGVYVAFFVPRSNYFLGKFLRFGGIYPDGVIRLVKRGHAHFPARSVHEQIAVDGRVGWLQNSLLHIDSPSFARYLQRNSRYIELITQELKQDKLTKNPITFLEYVFARPVWWFLLTQIRHKGILDGWQGIVFSFFSALRFPRAYWRYLREQ